MSKAPKTDTAVNRWLLWKAMKREHWAYAGIFMCSYLSFLALQKPENAQQSVIQPVSYASSIQQPPATQVPVATSTVVSNGANGVVGGERPPAQPQSNVDRAKVVSIPVSINNDNSYEVQPAPVTPTDGSDISVFAALMNDPDPAVAQVARDAYEARMKGE
jgi:hypothetical protein